MRVAVFRAQADGERTAARIQSRGHAAVLAPVIRIISLNGVIGADADAALIFTSAHAPDALVRGREPMRDLLALPYWCVGERTAEAAAAAGFGAIRKCAGTADALADAIIASRDHRRFILVTTPDRKSTIESRLATAGIALDVVEAYRAEVCPPWPTPIARRVGACEAALHYSHRSATLAFAAAERSGIVEELRALRHFCLSDDVGAAVRKHGATRVTVAAAPDEGSLFACLPAP